MVNPNRDQIIKIVVPLCIVAVFLAFLFLKPGFFKAGIKLSADDSRKLNEEAKSDISDGKYQDALKPLLRLNRAYPDNHIYLQQLAESYDHLNQPKEEAEYWEKYIDHSPTPLVGCPALPRAYEKLGDSHEKEIIAAYERCLALDPTNTDSIFFLAHYLENAGQADRAAELYQKGIVLSPTYADLRLGLARIWFRQDKVAEAKQATEAVLAKSPNYMDALLLMGMMYYKEDNYVKAKEYLLRGTKISDTYVDFHVLLARIADDQKDYSEEMRQYSRLVELRPNEARYRNKLTSLIAAQKK